MISAFKTNKSQGFTLIEVLVAVSIVAMSAAYFTHLMIADFERRHWDLKVNELLTMSRAVSIDYLDSSGQWAGQSAVDTFDCDDGDLVELSLANYLPGFEYQYSYKDALGNDQTADLYAFGCAPERFWVETTNLDSADAAEYIAARLPVAEVIGVDSDNVRVHIIKPRGVTKVKLEVAPIVDGGAIFTKPVDFACQNLQIMAAPQSVCVPDGENIGGYAINITDNDTEWFVSLRTRNDTGGGGYSDIYECNGVPILIRATIVCGDG